MAGGLGERRRVRREHGITSPGYGRSACARRAARCVLRRGGRLQEAERLELAPDLVGPRRPLRKVRQAGQLQDAERLQVEMPLRRRLQPLRPVEELPFGLQDRDRLALLLHLRLELGDLLGMEERLVFDRIGIARRADQRADHDHVGEADQRRAPRASAVPRQLGEGVDRRERPPGRRLRARGAAQLGRTRARIGRRLSRAREPSVPSSWRGSVGSAAGAAGRCREPPGRRPLRAAMNCLTMRSSSEWKVTTASRPPGLSTRSAACSARANSPSSSLTAMRSAWKTRVAGCRPPGSARTSPATRSASCAVVSMRPWRRFSMTARATARARRSSP